MKWGQIERISDEIFITFIATYTDMYIILNIPPVMIYLFSTVTDSLSKWLLHDLLYLHISVMYSYTRAVYTILEYQVQIYCIL